MSGLRIALVALIAFIAAGCMGFPDNTDNNGNSDPTPAETLPDMDVALADCARELMADSGLASGDLAPVAVYCFLNTQEKESERGWTVAREMNYAMSKADAGQGRLSLIDVQNMEQVYEELARQQSALIDEATRVEMWKQVGAELIVTGAVKDTRTGYSVLAKLVDVESGRIRSQAKAEFNRNDLAVISGGEGEPGMMYNDLGELTDGLILEYELMNAAVQRRDYGETVDVDARLYQIIVLLQDPSYIPSDVDSGRYLAMAEELEDAYIAVRSRLSPNSLDAAYRQMGNFTRMVNNWRESFRLHRW